MYTSKIVAFGAQKTRTYTLKSRRTQSCLVRILVQRLNWAIFLRKWAKRGRYSQWRSWSGHVERIFVHKNWKRAYWQHLVSTGPRYVPQSLSNTRWFVSCFWRSHYRPQSWCLTPLDYYLWGAGDKCCAYKPEDNWRFKGQYSWSNWWHTAAHNRYVLKTWTDRVGYCMISVMPTIHRQLKL